MKRIPISQATAEYVAHLRAKGMAPNTVKNYTLPLSKALKVWGDIQVATIKPVHIDRLFTEGNWSPRTRNMYKGSLDMFFKWSRHHGYMPRDFDPLFGWRNAKVPTTERMRLPIEQFYPLLDSVEHPRDRWALALGLFTFIRGSEMQSLRVNDLDLGALTLDIYRHKTKEHDTLPVSSELREEAVRWLNWYRQDQGSLVGNWFLVPSKKPDEWTWIDGAFARVDKLATCRPEQAMSHPYRVAQRALKALGYDTLGEGEHTLRRSGARALADRLRSEGADSALMRVASMLGHKDIRITQHYIGWDLEREQRNDMIMGQPLFPGLVHKGAMLRSVAGGEPNG